MKEGRGGALALPAAIVICNLCAGVRLAKEYECVKGERKLFRITQDLHKEQR